MKKTKALLLTTVALAGLPLFAASAADLPASMPRKAPIAAPLPFTWTGFYVGANVGGVWGRSEQTVDVNTGFPFFPFIPSDSSTYSGIIGGFQAGYNWQFSNIVLGIEADYDWTSAKKSVTTNATNTHNMNLKSLGTVRGRIGVAYDRWLPYITGGVAFARLTNELVNTAVPFTADRGGSATGWTIGGGLEYAFDKHWSVKGEYLYVKFPDKSVSLTIVGAGTSYLFQGTFKDSEQIARVGVNYRF